MKYYQCSKCHEEREDCGFACTIIVDNLIQPNKDCLMKFQGYNDTIFNPNDPTDHSIEMTADWHEIHPSEVPRIMQPSCPFLDYDNFCHKEIYKRTACIYVKTEMCRFNPNYKEESK